MECFVLIKSVFLNLFVCLHLYFMCMFFILHVCRVFYVCVLYSTCLPCVCFVFYMFAMCLFCILLVYRVFCVCFVFYMFVLYSVCLSCIVSLLAVPCLVKWKGSILCSQYRVTHRRHFPMINKLFFMRTIERRLFIDFLATSNGGCSACKMHCGYLFINLTRNENEKWEESVGRKSPITPLTVKRCSFQDSNT